MCESNHKVRGDLAPFALQDAPALIEAVFPAQKVSFEAQAERTAGGAQTLTPLGAYWKGRKPLILVRAIILGSLLPTTSDLRRDLEIFEMLMAFDDDGLARRASIQGAIKPRDIARQVELVNPWDFFSYNIKEPELTPQEVEAWRFPFDVDSSGVVLRWKRGIDEADKLGLYRAFLAQLTSYEEKATLCKRPEEVDQEWLYEPVWAHVNAHYAAFGIHAQSHQELTEQLGILRYGHRPTVGDNFAGGGSIPFEAARLACNVYAADLNPVACMLTWGAKNIIGAERERQEAISNAQKNIMAAVDKEISELAIEHNEKGDRIRLLLYCVEVTCPESGWCVPLLPTLVISTRSRCVAKLRENYEERRLDIEIVNGASKQELDEAKNGGTIKDGVLAYELSEKSYRVSIRTLRGDYRDAHNNSANRLRRWKKEDFKDQLGDIFRERLYAIQWIKKESLESSRQDTYFAAISKSDLERERKAERIVAKNLAQWQDDGLVPDMAIEPGYNTDQPMRERGWTYWHHLFSPRQILVNSLVLRNSKSPESRLLFARVLDFNSKLTTWVGPSNRDKNNNTFSQQKLSSLVNRAERGWTFLKDTIGYKAKSHNIQSNEFLLTTSEANTVDVEAELWITDPPYADAVYYHEITEFFIAWLRRNVPSPFDRWTWDSRRALAIKGTGDDFRRGMVSAYGAMTEHMPENGIQCVMFTHQDSGVWSDMIGIFWAAGLQVVAAWYIATETTSELKKGGYVQGTVILVLRKRLLGERAGFKQRILPAVRAEVQRQIETMMHLNDEVKDNLGEPVFNDSDLQMAGYAAALKVLTSYTSIGDQDVTSLALRPRQRGEVTVVDEIVQQAAEAANSLLVPEGLGVDTWAKLGGIQRFYLRMMDMETTGASKLDNYQNFAKAFRVEDYTRVMGNMTANKARLKHATEFASRDLTESTEIGATWLGRVIIGLQQLLDEIEPQTVISQLQAEMPDFIEIRPLLIDMLAFIERKASEPEVRAVAEVLGARLRNLRALGQ